MPRRYRISNAARNLFSNVSFESGRTDQDNACSGKHPMPHKTFSRLRAFPPAAPTADQLLLIAQLVRRHTPFDAADYLALARSSQTGAKSSLWALSISQTVPRTAKELKGINRDIQNWIPDVRCIYLFDRGDSFDYLRPRPEVDASDAVGDVDEEIVLESWAVPMIFWRYERRPRVSVTLTRQSVIERQATYHDAGTEALIGNIESGEHSLAIVNDDVRVAHRVFRGVFADAAAVAIFNATRMIVLPSHGQALRTYDANTDPAHRPLIEQAVHQLRVMRRFRTCGHRVQNTVAHLRGYLSYRFPDRDSA